MINLIMTDRKHNPQYLYYNGDIIPHSSLRCVCKDMFTTINK